MRRRLKDGTIAYGLRFKLPTGEKVYETLGRGIDEREARARADRVLAMVKLGTYRTKAEREQDRQARQTERETVPLFVDYAAKWLEGQLVLGGRHGRLSAAGEEDLRWRLGHLAGWFGGMALDEIDPREVEAFATAKRSAPVGAGGLSPRSTNMCLACLSRITRAAERHRLIDRDPAAGFRVRGASKRTTHLETAEQIVALLDAAGELDGERRGRRGHGRALLATLLYGGLRIDEALTLTWRDVDLAGGRLRVRASKTEAGERRVEILPPLRDDRGELKARRDEPRDTLVFGTASDAKDGATNVRRRVLAQAVERANVALEDDGAELIPTTLTPHGLRHTCASLLAVRGWDPHRAMTHMGHADARFTLSADTKTMARTEAERESLKALVEGRPLVADDALDHKRAQAGKLPAPRA